MRPILFVLVLVFGLASVQPAEAVVLFPRLALSRQSVVVQRQRVVVAQPLVVRQRLVSPVQVQQFVVPQYQQQLVVPQVQQFRSFQSFSSPGCGAFLVR
jgi:hypothetical protein